MRAKFSVQNVDKSIPKQEGLTMMAVTSKPFDKDGNSEDNSFSKWTPSGELKMTITNPNLFGKFEVGQKYYLDFTQAES